MVKRLKVKAGGYINGSVADTDGVVLQPATYLCTQANLKQANGL